MVPMTRALPFATGLTLYWLMHPVVPWLAWFHGTPLTQMFSDPGYDEDAGQLEGWDDVVYSPTTWYQCPATMSELTGCQ
jgi:hypothetical protein